MPTYIQKVTASDLSPSWANATAFDNEMSTGTGTDTVVNISAMAVATESASFITPAGVPDSDGWESGGTQTVEIEVVTANAEIDCDVRIVRLSSTGTILQSGSFVGSQTLAATRTYSPVAPTWTGGQENCDNRIAIELLLVYNSHGTQAADIGLGTVANEVITDISENSAGCIPVAGDVRGIAMNPSAMI